MSRKRRSRRRRRVGRIPRRAMRPESKNIIIDDGLGNNLVPGDGTSRTLVIQNLPSNLVQGTGESNFLGNSVVLKGVAVRFLASVDATPGFNSFYLRYFLFRSRANASNMLGSGAVYTSATTDSTAPTNASPLANPRIFNENTTPGRFVGISYGTPFDRTNMKLLRSKLFKINAGGAGTGPTAHKFYWRIGKTHQFQNPEDAPLTVAPNHGKYGSYYLAYQVYSLAGTDNISATSVGLLDSRVTLHFIDP